MILMKYSDLNNDVINNLHLIPRDIDVVIGIPRSGMVVANMIALYINKPLSDLASFLEGRVYKMGNTKNTENEKKPFHSIKKVLVVDDSVYSGRAILEAKKTIEESALPIEFVFLAAYVRSETRKLVDIYFKVIDEQRVFEWNYMHHKSLERACVDIDGVLCVDPTDEENDDGEKYIEFIKNAPPKLIPTRKIGYLVSSRLEKYRKETEEWLRNNGIQYGKLILMDVNSAEERRKNNNHGEYKAQIYKELHSSVWFIESNQAQARTISQITGKFVYCVDTQECFCEGSVTRAKNRIKQVYGRRIKKKIVSILPLRLINLLRKIKGKAK